MRKNNDTDNIMNKDIGQLKLSTNLEQNIEMFKQIFSDDITIKYRIIENKKSSRLRGCLIFATGMVDKIMINEDIILPFINYDEDNDFFDDKFLDTLTERVIITNEIIKAYDIEELTRSILFGCTMLLIDGIDKALLIETRKLKFRNIEESPSERVVKGPREGFIESLETNITLIRKRILTPDLKFKRKQIGKLSKTDVCYCYIEGIAKKEILKELEKRLDKISIDDLIASNYVDELIRDAPHSPFDTIGYTERPDVVEAKLLEGRIAILVGDSPFVLTIPYIFMEYFQTNEDYYSNYIFASFNRITRYIAFFLATSIPAIYLALVTFHKEILPTPLLLSIESSRANVPFPSILEMFSMIIVFDLLREAGIRLPEPAGGTITIVGALILGQAAVQAKFVSAPVVIVVAVTGMSAFLMYKAKGPIILTRFALLFLAGFLGLYGYIFGIIGLSIHLISIRSFGVPYMSNLGSLRKQEVKDTAIRVPWWDMQYRPKLIADKNVKRESYSDKYIIKHRKN